MPKQIVRIQVTFNVLDPDQQRLYEHVYGKINSSGYLKRLIQRDLDGVMFNVGGTVAEALSTDDDFNLGGFI
ncbi:hypothetical protein J23TS9_06240 [Paenibacillus sp. J23TS9]|uniref:hypothetical protein n=1 Tax=Paenibacillus sp. J23TS9 TaxID=2807193 RepID=UPI001B2D8403|nr:hypothetical protein [Paenibacillus sp. J23TS9]GIP25494.1 hypothetical protein J23TS9_06240 [Paenibacillus sp. J23TS9]